jgi:DNA-directed RNA polymerase subunit RPC12/RpoP
MTGTHLREIRCPRCGWWWHHPKEPLHFSSWDEWGEEHPEKEVLTCPNCGEVTDVGEGNVRFSGIGPRKTGKGKKGSEGKAK